MKRRNFLKLSALAAAATQAPIPAAASAPIKAAPYSATGTVALCDYHYQQMTISGLQPESLFSADEVRRLANKLLEYQQNTGSIKLDP